jgi:hypothetical protein
MNRDRVSGLIALYAVIARNEYANIKKAVSPSSLRTSTIGARTRWKDMGLQAYRHRHLK